MKIEDIRVFLKLAKTLSFFSTADALFLSPSAVSYSIKNLEKQLNVKLFHRSSHGVTLTEKGKTFYRDMKAMMAFWESSLEHLQEDQEEQKTLHVGLISMTLQRDFSNVVSAFIGEKPEVQLSLSVCPVEDPTAPLRKGKLDLAFTYQDAIVGLSGIEHCPLVSVPLWCVMSRESPLARKEALYLEDLRGQTIFRLPAEINATVSGLRRMGERIAALGEGAVTTVDADDHNYCLAMAEDNRGLTFAPVFPPTQLDTDKLVFRPIADADILLDIQVAWMKGRLTSEAERLVAIAKSYFSGRA